MDDCVILGIVTAVAATLSMLAATLTSIVTVKMISEIHRNGIMRNIKDD